MLNLEELKINFADNNIGDKEIKILFLTIINLTNLLEIFINLSKNKISNIGAKYIIK